MVNPVEVYILVYDIGLHVAFSPLQLKEARLQEEQTQTQQLESKLRAMESKLLRGDCSIVEHTRMQEATLAQQRSQMAEQRKREREIVARMREEEGSVANLQEGFSSLKQEVEVNTRRLRKLFDKLQVRKFESIRTFRSIVSG